jgi:3-isopropylmalate dehydrogenase
MLLRHSLGLEAEAVAVEHAVGQAIDGGARTADIAEKGRSALNTRAMGDAILAALN